MGLIGKGSIVGVSSAQTTKIPTHYVVSSLVNQPKLQIEGTHVRTQQKQLLDCNSIVEIDGMELSRYLAQADLDSRGERINRGKKRGRRPKIRA
jgi:hypothetical protein